MRVIVRHAGHGERDAPEEGVPANRIPPYVVALPEPREAVMGIPFMLPRVRIRFGHSEAARWISRNNNCGSDQHINVFAPPAWCPIPSA